jgi:hypothetical protein
MRKGLAFSDEAFNGFNNRQTAAVILTLVIDFLSRFSGNIELHDRGPTCLIYILLPSKLRNLGNVPSHYMHNRREFAIKSCLRELFEKKIKNRKDSEGIVKIRKRKEILRTGRLS